MGEWNWFCRAESVRLERETCMNTNQNEELEIDLLRLFRALWKKALAIVLAAAIFGAGSLAYTVMFIRPRYKAEALMYVNSSNISLGSAKVSISSSELSAAQKLVDTYIVIMNTRTTLEEVIRQSGVSYKYEELKTMINAEAVNGTEIFRIEVTSTDPQEAELLANTIAKVLPEKIASIVEGTSARIVDHAVVPTRKASPNITQNTMIGAIFGFLLACGIVVITEQLNDQIQDSDYLSQTYDLPVLAVIPDLLSHKSDHEYYQSAEKRAKKTR